jgi:hypothetical protein
MPKTKNKQDLHEFASGAKSSEHLPTLHLIPWHVFQERLAARYALGAEKYGVGNWEKGLTDRAFILDRANHTIVHLHEYVENIRDGITSSDDHLAAVIWGAICLMAAEEQVK